MGYDVAVIGAGVHGCAAAAHLALADVSVVVIDKGAVAGGPTGRSSAVCRAYYSDPFLAAVARESLDILAEFSSWSGGGHSGFRRTGTLFLHGPEDGARLSQTVTMLGDVGTHVELLDRAALAAAHPELALDDIAFGAWEEGAGVADPSGTTMGLWDLARRNGAVGRLNERVEQVHLTGGAVELTTSAGTIEADRLLIAAGPWTKALAAQVGADLPLTVERHFVTTNTWGSAPRLGYGLADVVRGFYLVPENADLFGLGQLFDEPLADPDNFSESVTVEEQVRMAGDAVGRVPALADSGLVGGWASLYDVSPDWQPVIGEIAPNVYVDAGTSGHGFKLAPALGRHVARLVLDGVPAEPQLDAFRPQRFAQGEEIRRGYGRALILG